MSGYLIPGRGRFGRVQLAVPLRRAPIGRFGPVSVS